MRVKIAVLASVVLCGNATAEPTKYAVDGLAVGMRLNSDDASYRQYRCSPSDQFDGFSWCQKTRRDRSGTAIYSLLHSGDGSVLYINRSQDSAFSNPKKAEEEIQQYSRKIGESPRVMKMPHRSGLPDGLIAVWGKITLEQLDQESTKVLADRKGLKKGLLIDFLGNFARSAKAGLPIYRIDGGPGFVWAASFDKKGRGILRLSAVDASRFAAPSPEQQPTAQLPGVASEASEDQRSELKQTTAKAQPELADATTTIADTGKAAAVPEGDQIEAAKEEKANIDAVIAPLEATSAVAAVSRSWWKTVPYGSIVGLLLVVLIGSTVVIYMRRQKARAYTNPIEAVAQPVIRHALSPEAALAKIEEVRRSLLLELTSSPSLAPLPTPEKPILPTVAANPRLVEKLVEPV
jgi:predicted lipid-binding transport protein (Tim44 family)